MTTQTVNTLAAFKIPAPRCSSCGTQIPESAIVETYSTSGSEWITAKCKECGMWTPIRLEKKV